MHLKAAVQAGKHAFMEKPGAVDVPGVRTVMEAGELAKQKEQLRELTASLQRYAGTPLFIAVDQEGGRVQRLKEGFTRLPPPGVLGRLHQSDPVKALDMAYRHGRVMAMEMLACGIDLSFAPVLDLDRGSSQDPIARALVDTALRYRGQAPLIDALAPLEGLEALMHGVHHDDGGVHHHPGQAGDGTADSHCQNRILSDTDPGAFGGRRIKAHRSNFISELGAL